ncbi:MAG: hypothetical protein FDX18_04960 [Chlorobium sp.]|nr:MAG: hypothetical protein FDX18_04960 [Chlorobium sp.]
MKKTARLLTLAVALFAGFGGTAQAADVKIGADVVSSYVWRGGELGNSPAIQPAISYTCPKTGLIIGAWGSYAVTEADGKLAKYRYQEVDLYATIPAGPFSFTITDYYVVPEPNIGSSSRTFDFSSDGPNVVEASVAYAKDNLSLLAAINIAGNKGDNTNGVKNAKYLEAGYKVYDKEGYTAKAFVGAGDQDYYGSKYLVQKNNTISIVNAGITVAKDRYTASYIYNPDTEKSNLVFMASF